MAKTEMTMTMQAAGPTSRGSVPILTMAAPCVCSMLRSAALLVNMVPSRLVWSRARASSGLVRSNRESLRTNTHTAQSSTSAAVWSTVLTCTGIHWHEVEQRVCFRLHQVICFHLLILSIYR